MSKRYLPNDDGEETTLRVPGEEFSQADEHISSHEQMPEIANNTTSLSQNKQRKGHRLHAAKQFATNTTLTLQTDEMPMGQTIDSKLQMGTIRHGRFQSDASMYNSG